jgi:hypothetical protein
MKAKGRVKERKGSKEEGKYKTLVFLMSDQRAQCNSSIFIL